jgi:hypothetical protein
MTRKAIIIGSPGPKNTKQYLKGVDTDLHHFVVFLKSPIGGSWEADEITVLFKSPSENLIELFQTINTDFLLVYFSGHGQQGLHETNIAVNDTELISVSQLISIIKVPKALIFIDTCRKSLLEDYTNFSGPEYLSFNSTFNQPNTREQYMQLISESTNGVSIAYACAVGEISNDSELGGDYTYSLLKTTLDWYENQNSESVLFINEANDLVLQDLKLKSNNEQNPQVITLNDEEEKQNFPFAIKTNSV